MAEGKKSFIAYSDWHGMFKALPDEVAGKLIKHTFAYVNDENPSTDDYVINALFEQIKSTLKRDLSKWEEQRIQRSQAGKRSAELRAAKLNDRLTTFNETTRNSTVSDSVNVNVNDKKNNINKIQKEFYSSLIPFVDEYGKKTVKEFYDYWSEPNKSKTKVRFQIEKTWDLNLRLKRWTKNNFKKDSNDGDQKFHKKEIIKPTKW